MGTNYYHEPPDAGRCTKCGHNCEDCSPRVHIGKSSAGWTFSFHATDDIRSWKDWQARLEAGGRIVDEYGDEISLDDFRQKIEEKQKPWGKNGEPPLNHTLYMRENPHPFADHCFLDPEGHSFSTGEFS